MPIKSPYPDTPQFNEVNAHYALLCPDQAQWSKFPIHVGAKTGQSRGFKDFVQRVEWAATALGSPVDKGGLGLSSDNCDMIGIMSENCMDYITFAHACFYITTPFALIPPYSKPFELKNTLTLLRATCLFIDEKFSSMVLPIAKEVGLPSTMIFIMTGDAPGHKNFSRLIEEAHMKKIGILNVQPAKKNTLAYLVFSSGTTGLPKAVMISHGNILGAIAQNSLLTQNTKHGQKSTIPDELSRILAFLSQHRFLMYTLLMSLSPTTAIIMSPRNIDLARDLIPKVHQLVQDPKLAKTDLIMAVGSGAAYLSPKLAEKLSSFIPQKEDFMEGYKMSEGTFAVLRPPSPGSLGGRLNPKPGSSGVLLPNLIARIVRDDGTEANMNEVGELWIKGPTVPLGYWNNEKATKETFVDGWLKTGDKFRVDEDGYFFFADRAKDTLKVSTAQVSPAGIEDLLLAHPKKLTVAGVSGGRTLNEQVPRAWIVLGDEGKKLGEAVVRKELERWYQGNLSKYEWLRDGIEIVNEISKSPTGKAIRKELQERFEQRLVRTTKAKSKL